MKKYLGILLILLSFRVTGQQLPIYSQYMLNGFLLNPATAGYDGYTAINLTAREQWVGMHDNFDETPKTYSLTATTRLLKRSYVIKKAPIKSKNVFKPSRDGRVGLGFGMFNDMNGFVSHTGIQLTYAYHIPLNNSQLSFGASGIMFQYRIDRDKLVFDNQADYTRLAEAMNLVAYVPDADIGIYYTTRYYYAGMSVKQLFQAPIKLGNSYLSELHILRNYHFMGGFSYDINSEVYIEPSALVKVNELLQLQTDFNVNLYFREELWSGLSFRTDKTLIFLLGAKINQFYFGYAYDYNLSSIRKYTYGSHEIMMAVKIGDSVRRYRWLNRY